MASLCNIFLQFRQFFKGLRVSNHKVRVSNYLVRASNPLLVIPKKFSAARGKEVRGLAQLIKYVFGDKSMFSILFGTNTLNLVYYYIEVSIKIKNSGRNGSMHLFSLSQSETRESKK